MCIVHTVGRYKLESFLLCFCPRLPKEGLLAKWREKRCNLNINSTALHSQLFKLTCALSSIGRPIRNCPSWVAFNIITVITANKRRRMAPGCSRGLPYIKPRPVSRRFGERQFGERPLGEKQFEERRLGATTFRHKRQLGEQTVRRTTIRRMDFSPPATVRRVTDRRNLNNN